MLILLDAGRYMPNTIRLQIPLAQDEEREREGEREPIQVIGFTTDGVRFTDDLVRFTA